MKVNKNGYAGDYGRAIGDANRKIVYDFLQKTPGASIRRTSDATGISNLTVMKAIRAIKAGWTPAHMEKK